jgi:hypothetical protein
MKPGDVIKIRGGTFTAAEETEEFGIPGCDGCAGNGPHRKALCTELPMYCSGDAIIWVAGTDPATIVAIAEFELEAS